MSTPQLGRTRYRTPVAVYCRLALARGPLVKTKGGWRFGRRKFSAAIVAQLLASGEAVRRGDRVEAV